MSIHFNNTCIPVDEIVCDVPCETKRNKRQPYLVMQGFANRVRIDNRNKTAFIDNV